MFEIEELSLELYIDKKWTPALSPLSFRLEPGEITGIIGESGSGKSLLAKALMNILPPRARVSSGSVRLHGTELLSLPRNRWRSVYGRKLAYIFQNPAGALNPLMRIGDQLLDALLAHTDIPRKDAVLRALKTLEEVGIPDPERVFRAYPHEISGGMKQRAVIACAVIHEPDLLIADEATTALDATVRKQILDLFLMLSKQKRMSILYISHDIAAVRYVADKIMVLYGGMLLETGTRVEVLDRPLHPYTADLLHAVPYHAQPGIRLSGIPGNVPPITSKPSGCIYAPRCRYAAEHCTEERPMLTTLAPHAARSGDVGAAGQADGTGHTDGVGQADDGHTDGAGQADGGHTEKLKSPTIPHAYACFHPLASTASASRKTDAKAVLTKRSDDDGEQSAAY